MRLTINNKITTIATAILASELVNDKKEDDVFKFKEKNSWNSLIKSLGGKYFLWSNSPDDITLN